MVGRWIGVWGNEQKRGRMMGRRGRRGSSRDLWMVRGKR